MCKKQKTKSQTQEELPKDDEEGLAAKQSGEKSITQDDIPKDDKETLSAKQSGAKSITPDDLSKDDKETLSAKQSGAKSSTKKDDVKDEEGALSAKKSKIDGDDQNFLPNKRVSSASQKTSSKMTTGQENNPEKNAQLGLGNPADANNELNTTSAETQIPNNGQNVSDDQEKLEANQKLNKENGTITENSDLSKDKNGNVQSKQSDTIGNTNKAESDLTVPKPQDKNNKTKKKWFKNKKQGKNKKKPRGKLGRQQDFRSMHIAPGRSFEPLVYRMPNESYQRNPPAKTQYSAYSSSSDTSYEEDAIQITKRDPRHVNNSQILKPSNKIKTGSIAQKVKKLLFKKTVTKPFNCFQFKN